MPLPRDSQLAAREARAVRTADIHTSEPNGTDIWIDVRVGMAKPDCSVPKELVRMEQEKRRESLFMGLSLSFFSNMAAQDLVQLRSCTTYSDAEFTS